MHPLRPLEPGWPLCASMKDDFELHACHSHVKVLRVASSSERLYRVDIVECTDWSSGTQVKTSQVSRLLWLLWHYKETAGGPYWSLCRFLSSLSDGRFAEHLCNWYDSCCRSRIFRTGLRMICKFPQGRVVVQQRRERRLLPLSCSNTN